MKFTFDDISEMPDESLLPPLDRGVAPTTIFQTHWQKNGYLIIPDLIPSALIDRYKACWEANSVNSTVGWPDCTPYLRYPEVMDLACYPPLAAILKELIGDDMGVHLNLTGWKSTQRNWHQDDYLNPSFVNCHYAAVWIALDTIHPDSGPFQFVPGSHKWPLTRQRLLFDRIPAEVSASPKWPSLTQDAVSSAFEDEIKSRGAAVKSFIADKGDVLIWHGRLAHRGSPPKDPTLLRKSFIGHYSALSKRLDMPNRKQHNGIWYFDFNNKENGTV